MDLIAIGVQECRFARARRGPNPATEPATPVGERDDSDSSNSDDGSPRLALIRDSPALEGGDPPRPATQSSCRHDLPTHEHLTFKQACIEQTKVVHVIIR